VFAVVVSESCVSSDLHYFVDAKHDTELQAQHQKPATASSGPCCLLGVFAYAHSGVLRELARRDLGGKGQTEYNPPELGSTIGPLHSAASKNVAEDIYIRRISAIRQALCVAEC
jgi:hypothetical protein